MPDKNNTVSSDSYKILSHTFNDIWEEKDITVSARFKKPSPAAIKRMQTSAMKDAAKGSYNLLIDCVHTEDKEQLESNLEKYPFIATTISSAIIKACGLADLGN